MTIKIAEKIVGYEVRKPGEEPEAGQNSATEAEIEQMHELFQRPEALVGQTYKVKTPLSEHALYVTINDVILNGGTDHELRRPFEIFINSKNMDHFQWIVALTRIISSVFRKGGDCTFLVEELRSVFDPRGGYFKKGGKFMPSLVAEIGDCIEQHLRFIGMLEDEGMDEHQQAFVAKKRAEFEEKWAANKPTVAPGQGRQEAGSSYPDGAQLCGKCNTKAMVMMDGCMTCLSCGDSKCG